MKRVVLMMLTVSALTMIPGRGFGEDSLLNLGPERLVEADGVVIQLPGYSVPSFVDWNDDNLKDLLIGEGGGDHAASCTCGNLNGECTIARHCTAVCRYCDRVVSHGGT